MQYYHESFFLLKRFRFLRCLLAEFTGRILALDFGEECDGQISFSWLRLSSKSLFLHAFSSISFLWRLLLSGASGLKGMIWYVIREDGHLRGSKKPLWMP